MSEELYISLVPKKYMRRVEPEPGQVVLTLSEGELLCALYSAIKNRVALSEAPVICVSFEMIPEETREAVARLFEKLGIFDEFVLSPDIAERVSEITRRVAAERLEKVEGKDINAFTGVEVIDNFRKEAEKSFRNRIKITFTRPFMSKLEKIVHHIEEKRKEVDANNSSLFKPKSVLLSEKYPDVHKLFNSVLPEYLKNKMQWCIRYQKNGNPYAITSGHYVLRKNAEPALQEIQKYIPCARLNEKLKIEIHNIKELVKVKDPKNSKRLILVKLAAANEPKKKEEGIPPIPNVSQPDAKLASLMKERDLLLKLCALPKGEVHRERLNGILNQIETLQASVVAPDNLLSPGSLFHTLLGGRPQEQSDRHHKESSGSKAPGPS